MSQLEAGMKLTSVLSHFSYSSVLESTWRFLLPLGDLDPLTHHKANSLIQVSFWKLPGHLTPCRMTVPLGQSRPVQVAFIRFDIQRRYRVEQLTFSADAQWSSWHDPELACFWVFSGGELIFSAVVCWPCSSRGSNNMFRDFGSLRLLTFHASCCKAQKCL